jgi:hypothetical protein
LLRSQQTCLIQGFRFSAFLEEPAKALGLTSLTMHCLLAPPHHFVPQAGGPDQFSACSSSQFNSWHDAQYRSLERYGDCAPINSAEAFDTRPQICPVNVLESSAIVAVEYGSDIKKVYTGPGIGSIRVCKFANRVHSISRRWHWFSVPHS